MQNMPPSGGLAGRRRSQEAVRRVASAKSGCSMLRWPRRFLGDPPVRLILNAFLPRSGTVSLPVLDRPNRGEAPYRLGCRPGRCPIIGVCVGNTASRTRRGYPHVRNESASRRCSRAWSSGVARPQRQPERRTLGHRLPAGRGQRWRRDLLRRRTDPQGRAIRDRRPEGPQSGELEVSFCTREPGSACGAALQPNRPR